MVEGREADFIDICRRQTRTGARSPGLLSFMAGYQRVDGSDRFVLTSSWQSEEDELRVAGATDRPKSAEVMSGVATIDSVDHFELREPVFEGILDAPGAVLRIAGARLLPGKREALFSELMSRRRQLRQEMILAWAIGERDLNGASELIAISAWPSPLVIEALAEPGRHGSPLFAAFDEFVTDPTLESYQAIELQLPESLADLGTLRVLAARFGSRSAAESAQSALKAVESTAGSPISVAPLGSPGRAAIDGQHVLVARVAMLDAARAERLIADYGGEVILASNERLPTA